MSSPTVGALTGDVYLAATGSGNLARLFAFAKSSSYPTASMKLVGTVNVDETTGVTTADFAGAPQVPFTSFAMTLRGGHQPRRLAAAHLRHPSGNGSLTSYASATR